MCIHHKPDGDEETVLSVETSSVRQLHNLGNYDGVFGIFVIITVTWLNIVNFNTIQSQVADEEEQAKQIFK